MSSKLTVAILAGGKSAEHEVSLRSAKNVFDAIDTDRYDPILISISKQGKWFIDSDEVALIPASKGQMFNISQHSSGPKIDVVVPILHGPFGEDGTVQGLCTLAEVPFVGAGVLGSAVGMDKAIMKELLSQAGLPIGKYEILQSHQQLPHYEDMVKRLGSPIFIKPANMGSSVGVHKVSSEDAYLEAIKDAFYYDRKIILEEFLPGRELECSVLGNEKPTASVVGEIGSHHDFYSYDAKYIDDKGANLQIPAELPVDVSAKIQELAVKTFQTLCCEGLGRVDVFLLEDGRVLINEINTLPGFTNISMYPKLWEATGLGYSELIHQLIQFAIDRFQKQQKLKTSIV